MEYGKVILPLALKTLYTYRIPEGLRGLVKEGQRVIVQFGKNKIYSGLVYSISQEEPTEYEAKDIISLLDEKPIINNIQYKFWDWLAEYYLCTMGEVMNAALPSSLKLGSETKIILNESNPYIKDKAFLDTLTDKEYLATEALDIHKSLLASEIARVISLKNPMPVIKSLIEKKIAITEEEIDEDYKPKTVTFIRLSEEYRDEKNLEEVFKQLEKKAFKQIEVLLYYLHLSRNVSKTEDLDFKQDIRKSMLLENEKCSESAINGLIKRGVLEIFKKEVSRLDNSYTYKKELSQLVLSEAQSKALSGIKEEFNNKQVVLLKGITSSGKTEIYIKLIEEALRKGKQVLYLVPEIALTTQLILRLRKYFPDKIVVYHSKFTKDERAEIWKGFIDGKYENSVVIGPRSSIFLPFKELELIIVDEEHDSSFKQYDVAPRFNARDSAIYLSSLYNSKVLLGSATPSIESYYNAKNGKYGFAELNERYGEVMLPEIIAINVNQERSQKRMKSHFSSVLLDEIKSSLIRNEQVILFQNRRGYSLRIECGQCGWIPNCRNCDVTLTYHKMNNQTLCHYCGYAKPVPEMCPACGSSNLKMQGFGTEKIEDEIPIFFSDVKVARMDLDTTRAKNSYYRLINEFQERNIDILIGTQMVSKGLDFNNVSLVGVLNADNMLYFPDFRTLERSFQQLMQVSGRAGRKKKGKVIIQTANPNHPIFNYIKNNDYEGMYNNQILERKSYKYPPFYRLIKITLKHRERDRLEASAGMLGQILRSVFGERVLGPEYPVISKIMNLYLKDIIIKVEKDISIKDFKKTLMEKIELFMTKDRGIRISIDVDP